jgi:hypothetical protein
MRCIVSLITDNNCAKDCSLPDDTIQYKLGGTTATNLNLILSFILSASSCGHPFMYNLRKSATNVSTVSSSDNHVLV